MSYSVRPHRRQPTRLRHPWDSPGKNIGVGCHCLLHSAPINTFYLNVVMLILTWVLRKQSLRQRFPCKYFTEELDSRELEWEMGREAGKNVSWNWPSLRMPGCWFHVELRSHRKTSHGRGRKKHFASSSQSLLVKGFPCRVILPHFWASLPFPGHFCPRGIRWCRHVNIKFHDGAVMVTVRHSRERIDMTFDSFSDCISYLFLGNKLPQYLAT